MSIPLSLFNLKLFFYKLFNWEYWPFQIIYIPIYFLWVFYSIKAKSLFFFNASNPTMKNGGFMMESKKEIYDLIPQRYYPKTKLIIEGTPLKKIIQIIQDSGIRYPFIAKPDIGLRGSAVKKINNIEELQTYNSKANFDFLVQDLIPFEKEVGVFYVRYPNKKEGKITGIVYKEFVIITGDGLSTIEELIKKNPRYKLQLNALQNEYGNKMFTILSNGEKLNLVPFGNHARGAKFIDCSNWISNKLTETINEVCLHIPGFYFGRLDIMYNTWEEFEKGENFSIVELNGAASEPTHIYDPTHSLFFAWKVLARHITYMYKISLANHKRGFQFLSYKEGMNQYRLHLKQNKKIVKF